MVAVTKTQISQQLIVTCSIFKFSYIHYWYRCRILALYHRNCGQGQRKWPVISSSSGGFFWHVFPASLSAHRFGVLVPVSPIFLETLFDGLPSVIKNHSKLGRAKCAIDPFDYKNSNDFSSDFRTHGTGLSHLKSRQVSYSICTRFLRCRFLNKT